MNKFLSLIMFTVATMVAFLVFPEGAAAILLSAGLACITVLAIDHIFSESAEFVRRLFLGALLVRILFATAVYLFEWHLVLGPDAITYDLAGQRVLGYWLGELDPQSGLVTHATSLLNPGWGMNYFIGAIYYFTGRNPLAIQLIIATFGAATVPVIYYCAERIFRNGRVARYSALAVAFFPSMILYSLQMLQE